MNSQNDYDLIGLKQKYAAETNESLIKAYEASLSTNLPAELDVEPEWVDIVAIRATLSRRDNRDKIGPQITLLDEEFRQQLLKLETDNKELFESISQFSKSYSFDLSELTLK